MVSQFQERYLSSGTHWNVDVASGSSRIGWEKEARKSWNVVF